MSARRSLFGNRRADKARSFPPVTPRRFAGAAPQAQAQTQAAPAAPMPTTPPPGAAKTAPNTGPRTGLRGSALAGIVGAALLVGTLGGWAGTTVIGGAVIARGEAVVDGRAKVVQHADGGIVETISVENGTHVDAGQVLMTLDPERVAADLDIARARLGAALARRARLEAEQAGRASFDRELAAALPLLPDAIQRQPLDLAAQATRQEEIFDARTALIVGSRARLAETQSQIDTQIQGLTGQITALDEQLASFEDEIETREELVASGLARQAALNEMLRASADLSGRRAALMAEIAGLETARREAEISTEQDERAFREEVATDLGDTTTEIEELIRTIVARQGQLDRMEIRAPAAGLVHELAVSTVGGVVAPGATLMEIVPQEGALEFEVRVDPVAINQVHPGQSAELVLSAFDPQTTPRLDARVATISPAAVGDPQTGRSFYRVELTVAAEEFARTDDIALVPGMPVEAYLATGDRTVLAYLADPLTSHIRRAFRE